MATAGEHVAQIAPSDDKVTDYDRQHLPLYAALLDAEDSGQSWQDAAAALMRIDITAPFAETCWRSHVMRAQWIVSDGLGKAVRAFGPDAPKAFD